MTTAADADVVVDLTDATTDVQPDLVLGYDVDPRACDLVPASAYRDGMDPVDALRELHLLNAGR